MSLIIKNNSHPSSFPKFENHLISKRIILKRASPKSKTPSLVPWQKASLVSALVLASCAAIRLAFSNETPPVHSPIQSIIPQQITAQQTHDVFFNNITLLSANQTSLVETAIKDRECDDLPLPIRLIKRLDREERIENLIINKEVASQKEVKEAASQEEVASQKEVEAVTSQKEVASQPESTWLKLLPLDKYICPLNNTNFSHPLESSPNKKAEEKEAEEIPFKKTEEIHVVEAVSHDDPVELVPIENKIENKLENKYLSPDAINNPDQAASKNPVSESSIFSYMPYMAGAVCLMFLVAGKICKLCRSNKKEPIPSPINIPLAQSTQQVVQPTQQEVKSASLPPTDSAPPPAYSAPPTANSDSLSPGAHEEDKEMPQPYSGIIASLISPPPMRRQKGAQPGAPNVAQIPFARRQLAPELATPSHPISASVNPLTPFAESEVKTAEGPSGSPKGAVRKDLVSPPVTPLLAPDQPHHPHGVVSRDLRQGHKLLKRPEQVAPPRYTPSRAVREEMNNRRGFLVGGGDEVGDGGDEDDSDNDSLGPASPHQPKERPLRGRTPATHGRPPPPPPLSAALQHLSENKVYMTPVINRHKRNPASSGGFTPASS